MDTLNCAAIRQQLQMTVLFWEGLLKNMHTTILKGIVGGFEDNIQLSPEGEGWIEVNIYWDTKRRSIYMSLALWTNPEGVVVLVFSQLKKKKKGSFWKLKTLFS